ncbi:putative DNA binding protein [Tripterygium wilfordii]|uniref:Putative DNA binding protein n=1 Tax=Tripterygium wilfordii TaxID=458696 RepID=A0A7J7DPG7_TRIWF|nr:PHD finger protein MALE STERILITY 1 [Tripterygium wilfordii]KAF5748094.1 putative DNA binding protein [Tripterygium wilfordii]
MSHLEETSCKRRKRGGERVYRFKTFGECGYPAEFDGSFKDNVKALLEFGHSERNLCSGMQSWSFQLEVHRHPPFHVLLLVVEEPTEASLNHHCKHCQYIGWGDNLICNKKYHFVLPSKDTVTACFNCERGCDGVTSTLMKGKSNIVELQGHIMHGVFHSNGFGHLLCVNGVEMGSELAGHQVMKFWDRLCTGLRAREVSLKDMSNKRSIELRLLHGVAYGRSWFGRWGYKFGRGCYGVTQPMYQKAIETIQTMPLSLLAHNYLTNYSDNGIGIPTIFSRYQASSEHSVATLGDLFQFMLDLKSRLPKENSVDSFNAGIFAETNCRWSLKRVEMATRVIVEALKRAEFKWIPRQEVRDAARAYIGDTGLLDFVLKSLGNHIVGNHLVRRSLNPVTKVLEYCLEDISTVCPSQDVLLVNNNSNLKGMHQITKSQLMKDLLYLYRSILKDQKPGQSRGIISAIQVAATIVLDSKYLVKEYCGDMPLRIELGLEGKLKLYCTVMLRSNEDGTHKAMPPFECITLKNNATFDELRLEVENNFRELYWGLRSFVVESIMNLNARGRDLVFGVVEVGRKIIFQGSNRDREIMINEAIYEGGLSNSIVDCLCGAKEDDGERMISCDICEVWQHTRCANIPNDEHIPHMFLCNRCEHKIILSPALP